MTYPFSLSLPETRNKSAIKTIKSGRLNTEMATISYTRLPSFVLWSNEAPKTAAMNPNTINNAAKYHHNSYTFVFRVTMKKKSPNTPMRTEKTTSVPQMLSYEATNGNNAAIHDKTIMTNNVLIAKRGIAILCNSECNVLFAVCL